MRIVLHGDFRKKFKKFPQGMQKKFIERQDIFLRDPFNSVLNNHELHGKYQGLRSIDITGDLRALYKPVSDNLAFFVIIGTHSELYE